MRKISKKLVVGTAATAIVAAGAGVAFAYWTSTGTGTGTATTGSSSEFVVTIDSSALADLSPNGPIETVTYHVKNTNSGVQKFTAATPTVTDTSNSGCTAADFAITGNTITPGSVASGDTVNGSFKLQMIETGANQNACQNATVNLKVAVS